MSDTIRPPIADDSGYCVRRRDLQFLRLTSRCVTGWRSQTRPLGLSSIQFQGLVDGLRTALTADGINFDTCDIRLKGSSACFFSGVHKSFPATRDEIIDLFREQRRRYPDGWEVDEIMHRLSQQWIRDSSFPRRRPFDSLYLLGVEPWPSDIDLQLSDDRMMRRCEDLVLARGQTADAARIRHSTYNFAKKDLVEAAFPNLYLFSLRFSDAVRRHVSLAVFPSSGPPDTSAEDPTLSAHFRPDDWRIR